MGKRISGVLSAMLLAFAPSSAAAATLSASWTDYSGGTATTRLERRTGTAPYTFLVDVAPGVKTYVDTSVLNGTTYCYRARAISGTLVSAYSAEACAMPVVRSLSSLSLINATTGQPIAVYTPLVNGDVIDLATLGTSALAVQATTLPATVGSVRFDYDRNVTVDNSLPYVRSNTAGLGSHTLTATPYALADAQGASGAPLSVSFTIIKSSKYVLTVSVTGPGIVTSPGISCSSNCTVSYASGTVVTLTAQPSQRGIRFLGWGGACSGLSLTCTVTMTAARTVWARFGI
jgi:hypothetical protein